MTYNMYLCYTDVSPVLYITGVHRVSSVLSTCPICPNLRHRRGRPWPRGLGVGRAGGHAVPGNEKIDGKIWILKDGEDGYDQQTIIHNV